MHISVCSFNVIGVLQDPDPDPSVITPMQLYYSTFNAYDIYLSRLKDTY
jgi:hypothetical protein